LYIFKYSGRVGFASLITSAPLFTFLHFYSVFLGILSAKPEELEESLTENNMKIHIFFWVIETLM